MKCLILLFTLVINFCETQAYHDYYHYQGYVPGPPGYVAEVEGECGCCPPPCGCVCVETSAPTLTTSTTTSTTPSPTPLYTLTATDCIPGELELCFVVDASGSADEWVLVLRFITDLVSVFEIIGDKTRVGMVTYGTNATVNWGLDSPETRSAEALEEAISRVSYIGTMRNTADGLKLAATQVFNVPADQYEVQNLCVVITGKANIMANQMPVYAEKLKDASMVMVVGLGYEVDESELQLIASKDEWVFEAADFDAITEVFESIDENCILVEPIYASVDPSPRPRPTKPTPAPEKECFCCCPPPPGYPDTCGFGHH